MPKFIAFDLSTNTGFAIFKGTELLKYGLFTFKVPKYKANIKKFSDFPETYPFNFMDTAQLIANKCLEVCQEHEISLAIIEHPESGKQRISQRLIEWMHYAVAEKLKANNITIKYILCSDWRVATKCYLCYWPEHKKYNQKVAKAKKEGIPTKTGRVLAKIEGKVVSKINQKKLSIILANEAFDLKIKDDNIADALNIGRASAMLFDEIKLQ